MAFQLVDVTPIEVRTRGRTIRLIKGDLTALDVDAIVFYARPDLKLGSGYGNALAVRGGPKIQQELNGHPPLEVTQAIVTSGGNLKARYVVHAVGPRFQEDGLEAKLKATIRTALEKAHERGARTIAFPPMGAGFYGIPLPVCARTMLQVIQEYLNGPTEVAEVVICVADRREFEPFRDEMIRCAAAETSSVNAGASGAVFSTQSGGPR